MMGDMASRVIASPSTRAFWSVDKFKADFESQLGGVLGGPELLQAFGWSLDVDGVTWRLGGQAALQWSAVPAPVLQALQTRLAEVDAHAVELAFPEAAHVAATTSALAFLATRRRVERRTFTDAGEMAAEVNHKPTLRELARKPTLHELATGGGRQRTHGDRGTADAAQAGRWLTATTTVIKYLENVLQPQEAQRRRGLTGNAAYRRINRTNPHFQRRLGSLAGGEAMLVSVGFREDATGVLELSSGADTRWIEARLLELTAAVPLLKQLADAQHAKEAEQQQQKPRTDRAARGKHRDRAARIADEPTAPAHKPKHSGKRTRPSAEVATGAESSHVASAADAAAAATLAVMGPSHVQAILRARERDSEAVRRRVKELEAEVESLQSQLHTHLPAHAVATISRMPEAQRKRLRKLVTALEMDESVLGLNEGAGAEPGKRKPTTGARRATGSRSRTGRKAPSSATGKKGRHAAAPHRGAGKHHAEVGDVVSMPAHLVAPCQAGARQLRVDATTVQQVASALLPYAASAGTEEAQLRAVIERARARAAKKGEENVPLFRYGTYVRIGARDGSQVRVDEAFVTAVDAHTNGAVWCGTHSNASLTHLVFCLCHAQCST